MVIQPNDLPSYKEIIRAIAKDRQLSIPKLEEEAGIGANFIYILAPKNPKY